MRSKAVRYTTHLQSWKMYLKKLLKHALSKRVFFELGSSFHLLTLE